MLPGEAFSELHHIPLCRPRNIFDIWDSRCHHLVMFIYVITTTDLSSGGQVVCLLQKNHLVALLPCSRLCIYSSTSRLSTLSTLFLSRYPEPLRDFADFLPAACNFSTVVFATFPEHHGHVLEQLLSTACPRQQLIFVVHNPEELLQPGAAAFLQGDLHVPGKHCHYNRDIDICI